MARYKEIPFEQIASVYAKKAGNVSATCSALGIARNTFFSWRNSDDELNRMLTEVEESLIDFSESKLLEKIQDGDLTAIIFHLKTKGKNRGYVERVENNVSLNPFEELMKSATDGE